jgi:hypothetical protein
MRYCDRTLVSSPISYGLCLSEKAFYKELKRIGLPENDRPEFLLPGADAVLHTFYLENGTTACIVALGSTKHRTAPQVNAMLVHEAMHLWRRIRKNIGERKPSLEFEAYAMQNISQSLMTEYARQTKKKAKA